MGIPIRLTFRLDALRMIRSLCLQQKSTKFSLLCCVRQHIGVYLENRDQGGEVFMLLLCALLAWVAVLNLIPSVREVPLRSVAE
jgi:hypothetical protein